MLNFSKNQMMIVVSLIGVTIIIVSATMYIKSNQQKYYDLKGYGSTFGVVFEEPGFLTSTKVLKDMENQISIEQDKAFKSINELESKLKELNVDYSKVDNINKIKYQEELQKLLTNKQAELEQEKQAEIDRIEEEQRQQELVAQKEKESHNPINASQQEAGNDNTGNGGTAFIPQQEKPSNLPICGQLTGDQAFEIIMSHTGQTPVGEARSDGFKCQGQAGMPENNYSHPPGQQSGWSYVMADGTRWHVMQNGEISQ